MKEEKIKREAERADTIIPDCRVCIESTLANISASAWKTFMKEETGQHIQTPQRIILPYSDLFSFIYLFHSSSKKIAALKVSLQSL